jgi:hypothetical protein
MVDKEEKFHAIDRFHISASANLKDFWRQLPERYHEEFGEPEEYEIWHNRRRLDKILETGEQYEIITKRTPGRNIPVHRRNSADLSANPPRTTRKDKNPLALDFIPE